MGDTIHHALSWAFAEAYHRDLANGAIHCTQPQWRPLTESLAHALWHRCLEVNEPLPPSQQRMVADVIPGLPGSEESPDA